MQKTQKFKICRQNPFILRSRYAYGMTQQKAQVQTLSCRKRCFRHPSNTPIHHFQYRKSKIDSYVTFLKALGFFSSILNFKTLDILKAKENPGLDYACLMLNFLGFFSLGMLIKFMLIKKKCTLCNILVERNDLGNCYL